MIDFDLLTEISKKVHKHLGSKSLFQVSSTELDLLNLLKETDLKIKNTESFFNLLEQKRISDLKFASFDADQKRRVHFIIHALNMLEESIKITKEDRSFNKNKNLILYLNYFRTVRILSNFMTSDVKKEILLLINLSIDSLSTDILFLKSWFLLFKTQILIDLGYFTEATVLLNLAKKMYFENYSDFFFTLQSDYGKNYWDEVSLKLQHDLENK
jgi:hypothetical protein